LRPRIRRDSATDESERRLHLRRGWPTQVAAFGCPRANLSDSVAMSRATHGHAPKYAGKDYVGIPGGQKFGRPKMMAAPNNGWGEAADLINPCDGARDPAGGTVTYDFCAHDAIFGATPGSRAPASVSGLISATVCEGGVGKKKRSPYEGAFATHAAQAFGDDI